MPEELHGLTALAITAHPDDIEFMMAGTLILLKDAGARVHLWNLANGCCGTALLGKEEIVSLRWREAQASAALLGAKAHAPLCDDIAIFYEPNLLARVAALIREVKPDLILTHSPQDYMEDHQNTCRLAVTGAFTRGMRNFSTSPAAPPWNGQTALYHALPHGLRDGLGLPITPELYVDISAVLARKRELLAQHRTQKEWLDHSQGMDSYLREMEGMSAEVGRLSGRFAYAEGWRRHAHLGFGPEGYNPLSHALGGKVWSDPGYRPGAPG